MCLFLTRYWRDERQIYWCDKRHVIGGQSVVDSEKPGHPRDYVTQHRGITQADSFCTASDCGLPSYRRKSGRGRRHLQAAAWQSRSKLGQRRIGPVDNQSDRRRTDVE